MRDHAWQSAFDEFRTDTMPILVRYGLKIGDRARTGKCLDSINVVERYTMLKKSFDPITFLLLKQSLTNAIAAIIKSDRIAEAVDYNQLREDFFTEDAEED